MEHEGKHIKPRNLDEFRLVLDLVAKGKPLDVAKRMLHRHPKTVTRAYNVACALHRHGTGPLDDDEVKRIVEAAKYGTTVKYVQDCFIQYKAWDQDRRQMAQVPSRAVANSRIVQLRRDQELLKHQSDIRAQIQELLPHLPFWPPEQMQISGLSVGVLATPVGDRPPLRWIVLENGRCLRQLDEQFDVVIEHLNSSGQAEVLQALEEWRNLGGDCIEKCHLLRVEVEREAERETGLATLFSDSSRPAEPGLWNEFSRTIYRSAVGPAYDCGYTIASEVGSLRLLHLLPEHSNLAWVPLDELERVKALHQQFKQRYRESALAREIGDLVRSMATLDEQLKRRLVPLSKLLIIPGECSECASRKK